MYGGIDGVRESTVVLESDDVGWNRLHRPHTTA